MLRRSSWLVALFVLVAACGSSPPCESNCGTGGADAGTDDAGTDGGTGGQLSPTFPCKAVTCMRGAEVCDVTTHFQENAMGACASLPAACKAPGADCTCFGDLMGCMCEQQPTGEFDVFCDVKM